MDTLVQPSANGSHMSQQDTRPHVTQRSAERTIPALLPLLPSEVRNSGFRPLEAVPAGQHRWQRQRSPPRPKVGTCGGGGRLQAIASLQLGTP